MRILNRVTLFAGAGAGADPVYTDEVSALARHLADSGVGIVYGGDGIGLMGVLADAALASGGLVEGVMPRFLADRHNGHPGLTRLDVVDDMHARKQRMADRGDAFVALPGGAGTLEELFEVWTWQHLGIHSKPVAVYDVAGYWAPLLTMLDQMVDRGFLSKARRSTLLVANDPHELLTLLRAQP